LDLNNDYLWGNLKPDEKIELWDKNEKYIWVNLNDGKIKLWDGTTTIFGVD